MVGYVFPRAGFSARLAAFAAERVEPPVDELAQAVAQAGERAADEVWQEDGARDVGCSLLDVRELAGGRFHLHQVAVFFAQGPVAWERGEREVEQGCEGAQLGRERVCCASAEEPSVEVADGVGQVACEVGVFLVRAHNVWCCGEGVGRRCWRCRWRGGWFRGHGGSG